MKSINENTLRSLIREILSETLNEESAASKEAKRMGLEYMNAGRWGKDGKVTHNTVKGKLVPVDMSKGGSNAATRQGLEFTPSHNPHVTHARVPTPDWREPSRGVEFDKMYDKLYSPGHSPVVAGYDSDNDKLYSRTADKNRERQQQANADRNKTGSPMGTNDPLVKANQKRKDDSEYGPDSWTDNKNISKIKDGWAKMSPQLQKRAAIALKHATLRNPEFDEYDKQEIADLDPQQLFKLNDIVANDAYKNQQGQWEYEYEWDEWDGNDPQTAKSLSHKFEFDGVTDMVNHFATKKDPRTGQSSLEFIPPEPDPYEGPYDGLDRDDRDYY